jgi:2-polyprenyl-6-methoxyphenol hydroxylase-like FAD-dependent oxidoreductase
MNDMTSTRVLVVGAGPVGLVLAMSLARHGVEVLLVERRAAAELPGAKCNHVSARSMEILRRLGAAAAVRRDGLPEDFCNDVAYRTTTTGIELSRIHIPCRRDRYTDTSGPDGDWPTPEPPHRINQIDLEPVLMRCAQEMHGVRVMHRVEVRHARQHEHGVDVHMHALDADKPLRIDCEFVVGCDGARSTLRRVIGTRLVGEDFIGRTQSTLIRAPDLLRRLLHPPAWATFSVNPRRCGNVYAIDGRERWLVHNYLADDGEDFDNVDRDASIRQILGVGPDFHYETLGREDWIARRLVAERFRDRRLFLCGDAAHIWVPMAGYGMNAGMADAENLAWLLAAHLNGWAPATLLDAYERERRPITEQVSQLAMAHALALQRQRKAVSPLIEAAGPEGDAMRAATGRSLVELNVQQYCCAGLNFGYFYGDSPLIDKDDEPAPAYTMGSFTPSTAPGCRLPHLWLRDGVSLYDELPCSHYALLSFDAAVDAEPLLDAARQRAMPLLLVDVAAAPTGCYRHALVISRPDRHVAWRGHAAPSDPMALINRLRGSHPH